MVQLSAAIGSTPSVSFLLRPDVVLAIDLFRALGDFEENYDLSALDRLEERLSALMERSAAKGLVSDALLLAFALRTERAGCWAMNPVGSRRATTDEFRLLALISACLDEDPRLAAEALRSLGVVGNQTILSLAEEVADRLDAAGMRLDPPDLRLIMDDDDALDVETFGAAGRPAARQREH